MGQTVNGYKLEYWPLFLVSAGHLAIVSQNALTQHFCTQGTILGTRPLLRVMAHPVPARHEDHGRRAPLARVHGVMSRAARHIAIQAFVAQHRPRRGAHGGDAVLVEQDRRADKVGRPAYRGGQAPPVARRLAVDGPTVAAGERSKVALQLRLHGLDGLVGGGAQVQAEAHAARDGVHAARRQGQDARRGECRVSRRDAIRVGDHARGEQQGVRAGREGRRPRVRRCWGMDGEQTVAVRASRDFLLTSSFDFDGVPSVCLYTLNDADFLLVGFEYGALLDMELKMGRHGCGAVACRDASQVPYALQLRLHSS